MSLKNLTALALTAALACTMAVPAFASDTLVSGTGNESKTQDATVQYQEANRWTISIPATITMNNNTETPPTQTLTAYYSIEPTKQLYVMMKGVDDKGGVATGGVVTLTRKNDTATTTTITTTVSMDGTPVQPETELVTKRGTEGKADNKVNLCTLSYSIPTGTIKAGTYTGQVTFAVGTEDAPVESQVPDLL